MRLIAFGDSNTRYWLGDVGDPGPMKQSWPLRLEALLRSAGKAVTVVNEGWPGGETAFARRRFADLTAGFDGTILAFGTNDIKLPSSRLEDYLADLEDILRQNGPRPLLVLSILWFGRGYGFYGSQDRLPLWNGAAEELCKRYGVPFLDTTQHFRDHSEWYNDHPVHHLNAQGQAELAEQVFQGLISAGIV